MNTQTTDFRQRRKVGVAGELMNQLMGNNSTVPEVGKGATRLSYSDRHAYQVIEVSEDRTQAKLEAYDARADHSKQGGHGHQNWILEPTGRFMNIVWRRGKWCTVGKEIVFLPAIIKRWAESDRPYAMDNLTVEQQKEIYTDANGSLQPFPQKVIDGLTKEKTTYNPVSIIFGHMEHYHDWSF